MGHHHDQEELRDQYARLRDAVPEVASAYASLHRAAMADGALSTKTKELVGLAIAITRQCEGCIAAHARGAARRGATAQEVAETVGVCILMNGGPGTVYGPMALAAFEEFASARAAKATEGTEGTEGTEAMPGAEGTEGTEAMPGAEGAKT